MKVKDVYYRNDRGELVRVSLGKEAYLIVKGTEQMAEKSLKEKMAERTAQVKESNSHTVSLMPEAIVEFDKVQNCMAEACDAGKSHLYYAAPKELLGLLVEIGKKNHFEAAEVPDMGNVVLFKW